MLSSNPLKRQAIEMRKLGKTYSEIRAVVPVAKSTLTIWLHEVGLAKKQKQRITAKRIAGQKKAAAARRTKRIISSEKIFEEAQKEIGSLTGRELLLIGTALYWAEGSKQKDYFPSVGMKFSNSDISMIALFIVWAKSAFGIDDSEMYFELYLHETHRHREAVAKEYWEKNLKLMKGTIRKAYYKRGNISTKRRNVGALYYGLLRVIIKSSTDKNRKVTGWIRGICAAEIR